MTRETKIGLLVGLAFIIVIGILLSDHMTSTTQPQTALLSETAPNVRQSVTSPAPAGAAVAQIGKVPAISPTTPVLTQAEINRPVTPVQQPVTQVVIGGPAQQPAQPITIHQDSPAVEKVQPPAGPAVASKDAAAPATDEATTALQNWAQKKGEEIVAVNEPTKTPAAGPSSTSKKAEYIAVAGDSLSKMASKLMGSDSKANREAIIKANATLRKNPGVVVIGRKYTIPMAPVAAAKSTGQVSTEIVPAPPGSKSIPVTELVDALPATSVPAAKSDGSSWYTVKENDNLWKIASAELGSGNAWLQIKALNKDVLKGGETVQPKMRIRIPAKSVAVAN